MRMVRAQVRRAASAPTVRLSSTCHCASTAAWTARTAAAQAQTCSEGCPDCQYAIKSLQAFAHLANASQEGFQSACAVAYQQVIAPANSLI